MSGWSLLEWIMVVGVIVGGLALVVAVIQFFKSGGSKQKADRGGVNIGGSARDVNTNKGDE